MRDLQNQIEMLYFGTQMDLGGSYFSDTPI